MLVQDAYSEIALHKFGTRELNVDQGFWTAGATLEWFGKMLKERKPIPISVGKGRANVELLELIRQIRTHQVKKLKPTELREALEYAGYHVSDEEALRLFEWRAKKKGNCRFRSKEAQGKKSPETRYQGITTARVSWRAWPSVGIQCLSSSRPNSTRISSIAVKTRTRTHPSAPTINMPSTMRMASTNMTNPVPRGVSIASSSPRRS